MQDTNEIIDFKQSATQSKVGLYWSRIKRKYKINKNEYLSLAYKQHQKCAICQIKCSNTKKRTLTVDHCHITNKVRGLLCQKCNVLLGMANDNTNILLQAIRYLAESRR
jgi:hypothetical protein